MMAVLAWALAFDWEGFRLAFPLRISAFNVSIGRSFDMVRSVMGSSPEGWFMRGMNFWE